MAIWQNLVEAVGSSFVKGGISSLQYADDTIIFSSPLHHHLAALKLILYGFENLSGLKINFKKSSVIDVGDLNFNIKDVASTLNCQVGVFPSSYLGMIIRPVALLHDDWLSLIDKVSSRLSRWKSHALSKAGRLVLLNSVLSALPLYWMSFYKLPKWVIKKMIVLGKKFFGKEAEIVVA